MTSSLVGSEMCIRDRYVSDIMAPNDLLQSHERREAVSVPKELLFDAVSYTHLTLPTICSV
eukprot:7982448-Prorocentrum_lima.AAC.1